MNTMKKACLLGSMLIGIASAQAPLTPGVSVQMATAGHAVEMRAADEPNAKVVAITADGKVYLGIKIVDPQSLSDVGEGTIYVKSDSRAPFQRVLTVFDALRGKSVVLLVAPPEGAARGGYVPPYGMKLVLSK